MNLVKWNEEVEPDLSSEDRKNIFTTLLQRQITYSWEGRIVRKLSVNNDMLPPFVQLRKQMGDSQVLLQYGIRRGTKYRTYPDTPVILMSMNGKAMLTEDDFVELNLAGAEARGVYDAVQDKED